MSSWVASPTGATLWEMRETLWRDQTLRNFVLNEPRGGVFRHVNLLVPPKDPRAQMGFIIMEPEDNPPMSGSNSICVATVLLDSGIIPMTEPVTELTLEAPGDLVTVRADCKDGKAQRIHVRNPQALPANWACRWMCRVLAGSPSTPPTGPTVSWSSMRKLWASRIPG